MPSSVGDKLEPYKIPALIGAGGINSRLADGPKLVPGKLVSILCVPILALIGLWGSSQVASAQARVYVANFGANTVSVIDTSSNMVVATVRVGDQPNGVAITPDGTRAYVANGGGDVWAIATSTNTVVAKVVVGGYPSGVAITPDGKRAYVTRDNANSVWVIDTSSNTVVAKIDVGSAPGGVAITPDGKRAYVTNAGPGGGAVSVIDTSSNTVAATVGVGMVPVGVAVTPDGTRAYVLNGLGNVSVIGTSSNSVVATVSLAGNEISPFGLAITPDGTRAYVTRFASNSLAVIDTSSNTVVAAVGAGGFPSGVAIAPDGTRAYVTISSDATGLGNGAVSVIDTSSNTLVATVGVGVGTTPYGVAIAPGPKYTCSNTIAPVITSVDSASSYGGYPYFASGSWLEIKGTNLADPTDPRLTASVNPGQWTASDFNGVNAPTVLDGISASINGKPAYVWYLSPGQINVQAPGDSATGNVSITVTNCKAASKAFTFARRALAPGLLAPSSFNVGGKQYMVATFNSDGAYVLNTGAVSGINSRPAKPGDLIIAYGIGFGDVTPPILPGVTVQQSNSLNNAVAFSFGSANATLSYFGLAGNFVGLYEFYITVPSGLANGDYQINVTQNGTNVPQTMYLTVHN